MTPEIYQCPQSRTNQDNVEALESRDDELHGEVEALGKTDAVIAERELYDKDEDDGKNRSDEQDICFFQERDNRS